MQNDPVSLVDPFGETFADNVCFLVKWLLGIQRDEKIDDPKNRLQEMETSPGANKFRDEFYREGMPEKMEFGYKSRDAAKATLLNPIQWFSTALQVGGFGGTAVNNGDGTVTFTINNTAGTHSFFYHAIPDMTLQIGPLDMHGVQQTFTWTEPISPRGRP